MKRRDLINEIMQKSGDEFETKKDFLELAFKTKKQLINDLININQFILNNK